MKATPLVDSKTFQVPARATMAPGTAMATTRYASPTSRNAWTPLPPSAAWPLCSVGMYVPQLKTVSRTNSNHVFMPPF